ncbi:unnamed protein product [Leptidea sinapis]|uniref:Uncharacterized protein n=1 Tax=Leptidea sinapis TaxID=189913 RepID=A0A5E4PRN5_9NEOP|nr:unnamed protein product [Leptidea sinapis]
MISIPYQYSRIEKANPHSFPAWRKQVLPALRGLAHRQDPENSLRMSCRDSALQRAWLSSALVACVCGL